MALVMFNFQDEYINELKKAKLEQPIVRLTNLQRPIEKIAPLRSLSVVSTAKAANGDIIKLERYCGQLWGIETDDEKSWRLAASVHSDIQEACLALKLEVRAGVLEEGS
ncbi:hypothetical protein ES708_28493 [subsurface metagenome]